MNRYDRKDVDSFHAIGSGSGSPSGRPPQNFRDASGASQSQARPGHWGNAPGYSIPMPSQGQPRTSFSGNPYDVRRMQDGISRKSDYGNPISRRTIVPSRRTSDRMEGAPSAKRMRTEYSHSSQNRAIPNTAASSRGHRTSQRASNKPQSRTSFPSNAEITIIVDDDEDMGVHITRVEGHESSPDPLRLAGNSTVFSPGSRPSRPVAHPFDVGDPMVSHAPYIEETNIIKELRQRNNHRKRKSEVTEVPDSESDGIEEFDDGPRADSSNRQNDNVRRKIKLYEEKEVQHLDLAAINKPRGRRPIAGSMKPRSSAPKQTGKSTLAGLKFHKLTSANQGYDVPDTISAPSFVASKEIKNVEVDKVAEASLMLPLEAWILGLKRHPDIDGQPCHDFLGWDEQSASFSVYRRPLKPQNSPVEQFDLSHILDIQVTNQNPKLPDCVVIQVLSRKHPRKSSGLQGSEKFFTPGSKRNGYLTFKFSRDSSEWSDTNYQRLVTFLKKQKVDCSTVDGHGSKAIWSKAQEAASLKDLELKREDAKASPPPSRPKLSVQSDVASTSGSRPKPRPAYKASGSLTDISEPVRRSTRQPSSHKSPSMDPDELILVYPPSGTGAINITQGDLNRLEDGEYLNDTLIEFGLKLWLNEIRAKNPDLADQIHVFSSFFYKKLKNNTKNPEEGYQSVRKWTQKFDLFQKKYLIVPINEHLHWYLVIIYQPEHVLMPSPPTIPSPSVSTRTRKNHSDLTGQLVQPPTLDHSTQPQDRAREMSVSRLPSPSPMGNEGEVEEMFNRSCSISADQSQHTSTASSSAADQKDHEAPEVDSIVLDDDGELHELQYPSPGTTTSQMDVDELAGDGLINDNMSHEVLMTSSKPLSAGVISSGLVSEKPNSVSSKSSAVGPASFYSSAPKKGKEKAKAGRQPQPFPLDVVDVSCSDYGEQDEVDELLNEPDASTPPGRPTTYIFTLDSLGSKHPQAIRFLTMYLKMEAKDKKNIVDSSNAKGFQALVPVQPNYCDCGLYLLHLAKTFLNRPDHHCRTILSRSKKTLVERQIEWDDVDARDFRVKLKSQVEKLSQTWKKEYAAKQAQKGKKGDRQESSDSEVDIVEDTTHNARSPSSKQTKAARIRG